MSGSLHTWYSLRDLESLGARQAVVSGALDLGQLVRLGDLLHTNEGSVRATLQFGQHGAGWTTLALEYQTTLELICQRCLEPLEHEVAQRVELAIVESPSMEKSAVMEGYEPIVLDQDRLSPAQLIEDELIVSLPLVPKHARITDCGSIGRSLESPAEAWSRQVEPPTSSN
jgi:uncharacterized protein